MKNAELYVNKNVTDIYSLLRIRAENAPGDVLFQYQQKKKLVSVTVGQFWEDIHRLRAYLAVQGLRGGRAALLGENSYYWILSYFAVIFCDAVVVPLDKDQSAEELTALLKRCPVNMLLCSDTYQDVAHAMNQNGVGENALYWGDYPNLLRKEENPSYKRPKMRPDQVCTIIFTSGTTGKPKGVMLSQRNIASNAMNALRSLWVSGSSVLTLPLHHTFGFTVGVLSAYIEGFPIFISKSLRTFAGDVKAFGPENLVVVPLYVETMYKNIWKSAREQGKEKKLQRAIVWSNRLRKVGIDLRRPLFRAVREELGGNLRYIVCGGAFLEQKYADGMEAFGIRVLNGYGITECAPVVAVNRSDQTRSHSVGLPLPGCEVRIRDGEICVRGDNVMAGYFEDEAGTKEVMEDEWFHTGDLGHFDGDGFLYITGRKKNLIILSNGENVSAEELEEKILEIQGVEEVVVSQENNVITAEIYAKDQTGIDEAVEALNRRLPSYKRIGKTKYRQCEFERTTSQKIKRYYAHKAEM